MQDTSLQSDTRFQSRLSPVFFLLAAVAVFVLSMALLPEYSSFTAIGIKIALVIAGGVGFDVFVLRKSNTYDQIMRRQNIAYAILLAGVYVGLGLAVGSL